MSETTSLSSDGFNRNLMDIISNDPKAASLNVDELFSSEGIRQKLAKKLLVSRDVKSPSTLEAKGLEEASEYITPGDLSFPGGDYVPTEGKSTPSTDISSLETRAPTDISFPERKKTAEQETFVTDTKTKDIDRIEFSAEFFQWRVFLNCVDTFNTKHIASFLCEKVQGSTKSEEILEGSEEQEEEEEEAEEEMLGEEEEKEILKKPTKEELPPMNYEIFGSLLDPDGVYDKEVISKIVDTSELTNLLKTLKTCAFIIYDVSRHPSQVREARLVCQTLQYELQLLEKRNPKSFSNIVNVPVFILISTFMTWARTKVPGPYTEEKYKKRKAHPNYADQLQLEKDVLAAGKVFPTKFKTLVLCSGVQYGHEEDVLDFLFRMAWENEPELPLYSPPKNSIPLIHIDDLAAMIFCILEGFPKKSYLLAVEPGTSTIKGITKAISKGLTSGEIQELANDQIKLLKLPKHINDCLSANVVMEPNFFANSEKMNWKADAPFVSNISNIILEYLESRNLGAKRILVVGPPASGKTTLSKKLAGYYQLHYLTQEYIAERTTITLKEKIERLKAEEAAALERERLRAEAEEEEEGEEEAEEEEQGEEEEKETIETLEEYLSELEQNIKDNNGVLDEKHLNECLRKMLVSFPLRNQGYVLDGFPSSGRQAKQVFKVAMEGEEEEVEEEEEMVEGEEDEIPLDGVPFPDYVIGIEASDDFLYNRVKEMSPDEVTQKDYEEEKFKHRLALYRLENTDETGVLNYFDEHEVHPIIISVDKDNSPEFEDTLQYVKYNLGEPQNFGLSVLEKAVKAKLEGLLEEKMGEEELTRTKEDQKRLHEERMRKMEQWALAMDLLRQEEDEITEADNLPLRHYLMRFVFPRLTRGLLEVERLRPSDPMDFLAEFLFKENPEGQLLEPEYTEKSRKFFQELLKCRDTLFSLTNLDKEDEETFFPKNVLENQQQEFDTYY